jgi:4-amino-4-deoxy-L-arabinose transferase-like glycosyltransferase
MRLVICFTVALLVRLAAIEFSGADTTVFGDARDYLDHAVSLCESGTYPERGNLPFFRAPGLPFFIAGVTACRTERIRAVKYALAACDAVTVVLLYLLALQLWSSRRAAIVAAALATLHPFFAGSVTDLRTEPLFMMFLVAALWSLLRERPALTGLCLGLAALVRPTALLCIPLFAMYAAWRRWRSGGVLIAAALLTIAPWTLRNVIRYDELIAVNDAAGFNFWRGTHPDLRDVVHTTDGEAFAQRSWAFEAQTVQRAAEEVASRAGSPGARDREWRRLAFDNMRRDPQAALWTLERLALYWRPWLHPAEHGRVAIAISVVVILGLYILGGLGMWLHPDRKLVLVALVFLAVLWLAHAPYVPSIRIRVPLTDPVLIVFAAGVIVGRASRRR